MTLAPDQASRLRALVAGAPAPATRCPVVAIASGKGGVGKTNLSVNLAVLLARRRVRTTLIDADEGVANADVLCGLRPPRRLGPGRSARDVAIQAPGGFLLVPGAHAGADPEGAAGGAIAQAVADASGWSDLVLLDLAPGVGPEVVRPALAADRVLLVTTPEPTSITDGYALLKCLAREAELDRRPLPGIGVVVNQARRQADAADVFGRIRAASVRFLRIEPVLAGVIRRDERVGESVRAQHPVAERFPRARATRDMARVGEDLARAVAISARYRAGFAARVSSWFSGD